MPVTTPGKLLVNSVLPEDVQTDQALDTTNLNTVLASLAKKYPEKYREVTHGLLKIAKKVGDAAGGQSFSLDHLALSPNLAEFRVQLRQKVNQILEDDKLTDAQRSQKIIETLGEARGKIIADLAEFMKKENNPLHRQVLAGARGSKNSLVSLLVGDLLYADAAGRVIPLPVLNSYSEGLTPVEYWAGAYGARQGVVANKFATREAGFFGKQLAQVAHRLLVTALDREQDDGVVRGLPTSVDDVENEGALLAAPAGGFPRNTVLTPKVLAALKQKGISDILVRSPIVSNAPDGGLYARDVGVRETGRLPLRGEAVGMLAAQAVSEPVSQGQLNAKHAGGVATNQGNAVTGFAAINQIFQVPKTYKGGAAHAQVDGTVEGIADAPAGGKYVTIAGQQHYVGQGYGVKVKKGDNVEAGDVISDGLPNPAEVVKHKGIGEGRRYFVDVARNVFNENGIRATRRNLELLARGVIDHVQLDDELDGYVPDDIISYSELERKYVPRVGSDLLDVKRAVGRYLERPYLHYSIGTKVRPSVAQTLSKYGIKEVDTHPDPPRFQPVMIRAMENLQHDPDWMTRMFGSGLKRSLLSGAHRGAVSDETGTSFVPGLARGINFGRVGKVIQPQEWKE